MLDIDGTMLVDDAHAHGRAMLESMRSVYDVQLPDDAIDRVEPWGKTDLRIAREALHMAGLGDAEIDRGSSAWIAAAASAFAAEAPDSATRWRVRAGLGPALTTLAGLGMRLTVTTGNLRAIATEKVSRMALADRLDLAAGAYGDDAEDRTRLVPIARRRAGSPQARWPRARTVVVGDTPGDIAAARADGVASVVFSSSRFPAPALREAGAVIAHVGELVATLESWQMLGSPA